ncbi:MAG: D-cysteine desulfhydrase family protein [Planctomycetota bacterium]
MSFPSRHDALVIPGGDLHPAEPARLKLATTPTPLERCTRLLETRGLNPNATPLLIKRDDHTGLATSGNKVRKLEYLVADALEQGADTLVTMGGVQSNHCRATAAVAARLGLRSRLILRGRDPRVADPSQAWQGNLVLDELFGAEVSFHAPTEYTGDRAAMLERVLDEVKNAGRTPYFFPTGGSVELGSWGYVRCVFELAEQLERADFRRPIDLFCGVGSCGTHAGCVVGRALAGLDDWRIVGVPIAATAAYMASETRLLVDQTSEMFGLGLEEAETPVEVLDGFVGRGYAMPSPEGTAAIRDAARTEGLILDPSYTGKTMAGVLHAIDTGFVRDGAATVFLHSGGSFGLLGAAASGGWSDD